MISTATRRFCRKFSVALALISALPGAMVVANHAMHNRCDRCGNPCEHSHLVARTVMVPMEVVETRMKTCVVNKTVERDETYTVFKRVPEKRKFTKQTCYLADEVKTQTVTEKQCHVVMNPVERDYKVNVPEVEIHEGTQTRVCHHCGQTYCIEEPCTCTVTRTHEEPRHQSYQEPDVVFTESKKDISYVVKVPKKKTEVCAEETVYKLEPVQKTRKVQVCIPELVKQPVEVKVVKMVEKTIYCCETCSQHH